MDSLLNLDRPPVFCPGCSHTRVTRALDNALSLLKRKGHQVAIVSDIGCSGLFDTFFHTHALHGLHGRALTYAAGIKLARPDLTVIVTMGDGGLGIGGAHLLAACRRNLDITLLVLNNFNFGMTGGQYSVTTPTDALVGSGFLNRLEHPMDVGRVAVAAGAGYVSRCSSYRKDLAAELAAAIRHEGFALLDMWGVCTGRYTRRNRMGPKQIDEALGALEPLKGPVAANQRPEYGRHYRQAAQGLTDPAPLAVPLRFAALTRTRQEILILGSAGQRINTAGELLCLAGMTGGLQATQKNEYNITVLRGPSLSEIVLCPTAVGYTGITKPTVVLALSDEGVQRRRAVLRHLDETALIIRAADVDLPPNAARTTTIDFKALQIKGPDRALAALTVLAAKKTVVDGDMLTTAIELRFKKDVRQKALALVARVCSGLQ